MRNPPHALVAQFREHCVLIDELRDRVLAGSGMAPQQVHREALAIVEAGVAELRRGVERLGSAVEGEFRYAAAAWADECFLKLDWGGRGWWRGELVETRLFGSRAAGQRIFERIDGLLGSDDAGQAPMAAVYLTMLGIGFRGRHWDEAGRAEVERRRAELWKWIEKREPRWLSRRPRVAPQAYEHTVQEGPVVTLPVPARWWAVAALVAGFWIGGSSLVWKGLAGGLVREIDALERRVAGDGGGFDLPAVRGGRQ